MRILAGSRRGNDDALLPAGWQGANGDHLDMIGLGVRVKTVEESWNDHWVILKQKFNFIEKHRNQYNNR